MRRVFVILTVLFLPSYSFCASKILVVPDKYPNIQQAINSARPGDKIKVKQGIYAETLIFKNGVNLEGADQNNVIIRCDANSGVVITADDCNSGSISCLTLEHIGRENAQDANKLNLPIIKLTSSSIKISKCTIQNGGDNGITIKSKGNCEISDCIIQNNKHNGIYVCQESTSPQIRNNKCANNGINGILFAEGSSGTVEKNICSNNSLNGISVVSEMASPKLISNICSENNGSGIYFGDGAKGSAESNICSKNKKHGISIANDNCTVILKNNQCMDNIKCGIDYSIRTNSTGTGNIIKNNGQINFRQLRIDLWAENFDELEETVSKLRKEKSRFDNSKWQLSHFYNSLGGSWADYRPSVENKLFGILNDWIKAKPDSITPRIVMAYAYRDYAWHARGGDYAPTVSNEMRKIFHEKLNKAWNILEEAEKLSNKNDPEFYDIFFLIGRAQGKPDKEVSYLFDKGVAIDKNYSPIYGTRAYFLLPRWGGGQKDSEKFAENSENSTKDSNEFIYARIAANLVWRYGQKNHDEFRTLGFSYYKIKKGHIEILKKYPEADYYLNTYCLLACVYRDKETAKELFKKIGDNWDSSVWYKEEYFKKYKNLMFSEEKK